MDTTEKWRAVISNDTSYDGIFYYGVKSTGIYCKPSCKSKNPSPKNVSFFSNREEAELAGFRPCKRCRPDLLSYDPSAEIAETAKILIDRNFSNRLAIQDKLNAIGVTRRHLTELFEKQYEMSPSDYIAKQTVECPYCFCETPIGILRISENETGISEIRFAEWKCDLDTNAVNGIYLADAKKQLQEYFATKRKIFDVPLSPHGSEFQQTVWRQLQKIPYGETRSYQDIAHHIGNPKAARAVGMANNRNPILIMIPCHRVVGKNNQLAGYAGGIQRKQYLLNLEVENDK